MTLELLPMEFTVCKLFPETKADLSAPFTFFARTDQELSLVCPSACAPADPLAQETGWRCFRVRGPLVFSLVGVLSCLSACLAEAGISIFAISTFDTDYLLVRKQSLSSARDALTRAGHEVVAAQGER